MRQFARSPKRESSARASRSYYWRHREEISARKKEYNSRSEVKKKAKEKRLEKKEINKEYYQRNKDRYSETRKRYYETHCNEIKEKSAIQYQRSPETFFYRRIKGKYGLCREEYDRLLKSQGGRCAICWELPNRRFKHLVVDHDHDTGEVRGLLCSRCNRAIGLLCDDPDLIQEAVGYLRDRKK